MIAPRTPPRVRCQFLKCFIHRGVAQPGSAPPWGGGGRRFKSSRPDQHPCRGNRIPGQPSSMTTGVRRCHASPSRPDQLATCASCSTCKPGADHPWSAMNVHRTFATPHPCRGVRISGQPSSMTTGVRRCRASPSRPDQPCKAIHGETPSTSMYPGLYVHVQAFAGTDTR